jgi:acetolactate synthase-1/3 small subunit
VAGQRDKVQAIIEMLRPYGIIETARTGQIVLGRHNALLKENERRMVVSAVANTEVTEETGIYNLHQSEKEKN